MTETTVQFTLTFRTQQARLLLQLLELAYNRGRFQQVLHQLQLDLARADLPPKTARLLQDWELVGCGSSSMSVSQATLGPQDAEGLEEDPYHGQQDP